MEHVYKVGAIGYDFFLNLFCIVSHALSVSSVLRVLRDGDKRANYNSFLGDNFLETYMD